MKTEMTESDILRFQRKIEQTKERLADINTNDLLKLGYGKEQSSAIQTGFRLMEWDNKVRMNQHGMLLAELGFTFIDDKHIPLSGKTLITYVNSEACQIKLIFDKNAHMQPYGFSSSPKDVHFMAYLFNRPIDLETDFQLIKKTIIAHPDAQSLIPKIYHTHKVSVNSGRIAVNLPQQGISYEFAPLTDEANISALAVSVAPKATDIGAAGAKLN